MRAVVQRVLSGEVTVDREVIGKIGRGLLVYLSVGKGDSEEDSKYMAEKICNLRIFEDEQGKMNKNVMETGGEILLVSNFTLYGDCRKGRRPGFDLAAEPGEAERLYEEAAQVIRNNGVKVGTGRFAADMKVTSVNDGPINFLLDSERIF